MTLENDNANTVLMPTSDSFGKYTVLIVEDEEPFRKFLVKVIEKQVGASVAEAQNPKDAFQYLRLNKPDLIMLDMQMPMMDGHTTLRYIRSNNQTSSIPVIVCSALSYVSLFAELAKLKISDYIVKPSDTRTISDKVKKALLNGPIDMTNDTK